MSDHNFRRGNRIALAIVAAVIIAQVAYAIYLCEFR